MNDKQKPDYKTISVPPSIHQRIKAIAFNDGITHIKVVERAMRLLDAAIESAKKSKGGE